MKQFSNSILSLPRNSKRAIAIIVDVGLCVFCTWIALILRFGDLILLKDFYLYPVFISVIIAIPIFSLFGLYRTIFRFADKSILLAITLSTLVYGILYFSIIGIYGIQGIPRTIGVLQPMILFLAIVSSRLGVKFILNFNFNSKKIFNKKNVLVYGTGKAGRQLVAALESSLEFKVVGFIDDDKKLHKQILLKQTVYDSSKIESLVLTKNINLVFLALPTISRSRRNQIIENLSQFKLSVKTLPSIAEIVDGRITISDIKDLNIDDLLNRNEVKPNLKLLNKNINSKTVLVTGAGGSIGSELCRQILKLKPNKLLLIEFNEFALYKTYEELIEHNKNTQIFSLLVNVQDQKRLENIFGTFKVDTIYHAAAYKHVPLVEENICEGVKNNVFGTLALVKASLIEKVSNVVLISSDKAVRPTNIMGASKRLSELCMQGIYNNNKDINTNFSIVRFGNVLESSGSVIPKFKKQIKEGGPVTLTHKNVTRYFMTVTEAAQLVIQAGAIGKKSEVFVLDMGKSVKIIDLIYKMINLSGLSIKDNKNPNGDIEVKIIGLRPGEKLYEELLIGDNPEKTIHPKILKTTENHIPFHELELYLNNLKSLLDDNKIYEVKKVLDESIKLYKSNSKIVDHLFVEKLLMNKHKKNLSFVKDNNVIKIK